MKTAARLRALLLLLVGLTAARADESPVPAAGSAADLYNPYAEPPAPRDPAAMPCPRQAVPPRDGNDSPTVFDRDGGIGSAFRAPIWQGTRQGDRERRKLKGNSSIDIGIVETEVVWQAPEAGYESPFERGAWSTEDLLAIPVTGPLYVFGEVVMDGAYAADQSVKVAGKTGVMMRLALGDGPPLEVRGGPALKYRDALRVDKNSETGAMLWEVKAKMPLVGVVGLEYVGEAAPGLTPEERSKFNSDMALAIPVSGGKLKLGARHRWEDGLRDSSAAGATQWYLGLEIGR